MSHPQLPSNPDEIMTDEEYYALVQDGDRLFEQATQAWLRYFEEHPEDRNLELSALSEKTEIRQSLDTTAEASLRARRYGRPNGNYHYTSR